MIPPHVRFSVGDGGDSPSRVGDGNFSFVHHKTSPPWRSEVFPVALGLSVSDNRGAIFHWVRFPSPLHRNVAEPSTQVAMTLRGDPDCFPFPLPQRREPKQDWGKTKRIPNTSGDQTNALMCVPPSGFAGGCARKICFLVHFSCSCSVIWELRRSVRF